MIRRAGLLFGWAIRHSSAGPSLYDAHREAAMRAAIAAAPERSAAVVGSFHAAALLPQPLLWSQPKAIGKPKVKAEPPTTSLVSYSFSQLDQRSGYPAGVMDPVWQQAMWSAASPQHANQVIADLAVKLCRELRAKVTSPGHPMQPRSSAWRSTWDACADSPPPVEENCSKRSKHHWSKVTCWGGAAPWQRRHKKSWWASTAGCCQKTRPAADSHRISKRRSSG